ncbi:MAG: APC family permease [Deltaproteobacteria bacterium]|nr:MAG: APC family permease [Deltaproteobacteria bacterium]
MSSRLKRWLFGAPRDIQDPSTYHAISLIALLAWVGLGADGLSSSAYGPDEAFRALGSHTYLAIVLALATAVTVFIISFSYSHIIKHFPYGGGGYVVASKLLGPSFGVISGSALIVDYILTVSVSIASGADQVFSVLPGHWAQYKLVVEALVIIVLVIMNLRGVKESVTILAPVFALFIVCHAIVIFGGIFSHLFEIPRVVSEVKTGFSTGYQTVGLLGMLAIFARAYSMGGGTYTGIEAVSNGLQIMREPKVETGRKTMTYMSISLALTAGGILLCYLLFSVFPQEGKTMNAVLLENFSGSWMPFGIPLGHGFVVVTLATEAALLFVAAQAGFIDGPRVMANMAIDSWLPHRFSQLSDRLTTQDGIVLVGGASIVTLLYTGGNITALVTMYSINVFVTFSLSQLAMCRFWISKRHQSKSEAEAQGEWKKNLAIYVIAFALCFTILAMVIYEKFAEGGWMTLAITSGFVLLCIFIRRHYHRVYANLKRLDEIMNALPEEPIGGEPSPVNPKEQTAILMVGGYGGLGIHALLTVQRLFPDYFRNFIFVSVGVIDSAAMKGHEEVEHIRQKTEESLKHYVALARRLGLSADYRMSVGTEAVDEAIKICQSVVKEFPQSICFAGKLIFEQERWYQRLLHNETAFQIQRRLQFAGLNGMVLPVRVMTGVPS